MNVLCIGAHPDDAEFQCAGTLARYAQRGDSVTIAVVTNGNVGSSTLSRTEIAEIRHQEARRSADLIGADLIWMDFDDEFLFDNHDSRLAMIEVIRQARPEVMIVHSPHDYHPDHCNAGRIAIDARIPASVPLIETEHPPCPIPHVFMMDTFAGIGFTPDAYVDVTSTFDIKAEMLSQHRSQNAWMMDMYNCSAVEVMKRQSQFRGLAITAEHAEAFQSLATYPVVGGVDLLPHG